MEVTDAAAVEAIRSVDRDATSRDLVRYVSPSWEDVLVVERRKLPQVLTESHSEQRPPRRMASVTYEDDMEVSDAEGEGQPAESVTAEAWAGSGSRKEGDAVQVMAGRSQ